MSAQVCFLYIFPILQFFFLAYHLIHLIDYYHDLHLLQLFPLSQPAVLCPSTCPSVNVFTSLKMASSAGIFRISGSLAKDHVDRFTSGHHHHESVVSVFLNIFNHVYAILKHCYLFHCLSIPCPSLLSFSMQKSFFLHDFKAQMQKLSRKVFYLPINCL